LGEGGGEIKHVERGRIRGGGFGNNFLTKLAEYVIILDIILLYF